MGWIQQVQIFINDKQLMRLAVFADKERLVLHTLPYASL